jgi:hypothetical protein
MEFFVLKNAREIYVRPTHFLNCWKKISASQNQHCKKNVRQRNSTSRREIFYELYSKETDTEETAIYGNEVVNMGDYERCAIFHDRKFNKI